MHSKGFTFPELLITMFIIGILVLISVPFLKSLNKQIALSTAAAEMAQNIRSMEEMAMSAQETGGSIPAGGYGISLGAGGFPKTSYSLCADVNNDKKCSSSDNIKTINLENGIEITDSTSSLYHIIFKAPDPSVLYTRSNGSEISGNEAYIRLSYGANNIFIRITKAGLIYVQ